MPFNPSAEAAYRAGQISAFELHRLTQDPAVLTGGPPPFVPGQDPTSLISQAQDRARGAMRDFLATHKAMPPAFPGGPMRWYEPATGAVLPASAAPPI